MSKHFFIHCTHSLLLSIYLQCLASAHFPFQQHLIKALADTSEGFSRLEHLAQITWLQEHGLGNEMWQKMAALFVPRWYGPALTSLMFHTNPLKCEDVTLNTEKVSNSCSSWLFKLSNMEANCSRGEASPPWDTEPSGRYSGAGSVRWSHHFSQNT